MALNLPPQLAELIRTLLGQDNSLVSPVSGSSQFHQSLDQANLNKQQMPQQAPQLAQFQPQPTQQPQPIPSANPDIDSLVKKFFPDHHDEWYQAMSGENATHDPTREYTHNTDGSIDRGVMQINSNTFDDFMRRHGDFLKAQGINDFKDMFDPAKNILMGRLIYKEQGWNAWHGAPASLKGQK